MPKTRRRLLAAVGIAATFALAGNAAAQTFSLAPGSPTVPLPGAACGLPFSPAGDILMLGAVSIVPMGPPGCGLGWFGPPPPMAANVDGFSAGLLGLPPPPIPVGLVTFLLSVDGFATGDAGGCLPFAPGFTPPDVGTEASALTDAPADVYAACWGAPGCPPPPPFVPVFAPYSMSNFQIFDGDGVPVPPYAPAPAIGLLGEPAPPGLGDDVDAFDGAPAGLWVVAPGVPATPAYFSVDGPTAAVAGVFPSDVFMTAGGFVGALYAPPFALGLDLIGGPGTDDLDALEVFDADGFPAVFTPLAGDVALFSVAPGSAIIGTPSLCPGPLAGYPIGPGDILTEGTSLGAPGAACVLVPSTNIGLWNGTAFGCVPNPFGAVDDNLNALAVSPPLPPPPPPATPTVTVTATPTVTPTPTVTATPTSTPPPLPVCAGAPLAGCRTPSAGLKALFILKDKSPDDKDIIIWKWIKGSVTTKADYGTPLTSTHYQLCVYNGTPSVILDATIPAGGMCDIANPKPCWQDKPTGFKYKDKDATPDGITKMVLKEGLLAGKAKIIVKGKGALLDDPTPGGPAFATSPITVQLSNGTTCWEAVYSSPFIKNVTGPPGLFKDKAD